MLTKLNLQQIPSRTEEGRLMRSCFISTKDSSFVGGDYSGCELRVIADQSQDRLWLDTFLQNRDLHTVLCAATFGIEEKLAKSPSTFKPDISFRDIQKTINFGLALNKNFVY